MQKLACGSRNIIMEYDFPHGRFELDMLLETTAVTTQRMEEFLQKLQEVNVKQDSQVQMGDYLKGNK